MSDIPNMDADTPRQSGEHYHGYREGWNACIEHVAKPIEAELKLARERLGPAGYKVLERLRECEEFLNLCLELPCRTSDGGPVCDSVMECEYHGNIKRYFAKHRPRALE